MKMYEVKEKLQANESISMDIMRNPADLAEWVVWIREVAGRSFLLCDDSDVVIATTDVNVILQLLNNVGVKQVAVVL